MDERRDARGRRRAAGQERGLRPLYPRLPEGWISRALRASMPAERWQQLDDWIARARPGASTEARAAGQALMALLDAAEHATPEVHWLDWEREKTWRLLQAAGRAA
jgi:hypothetical protein